MDYQQRLAEAGVDLKDRSTWTTQCPKCSATLPLPENIIKDPETGEPLGCDSCID